jgi:hypothetical protein
MRHNPQWLLHACDEVEVLDCRERLVEAMKEPPPVLVFRRFPESLGVVFETLP